MKILNNKKAIGILLTTCIMSLGACSEYPLVSHTEMKANKATSLSEILDENVEVSEFKSENPKLKLHQTSVYYKSDEYQLDKEDISKLDELVDHIDTLNDFEIIVETHTDLSGDIDENKILSNQRGDSIYMYLISNSIPTHKIIVKSMGSDKPAVYGDSDYSRSMNRRSEVTVIPKL